MAPDEYLVIHHSRLDGETLLTRLHRRDDGIDLDPPGLRIAVADLYADTDLPAPG